MQYNYRNRYLVVKDGDVYVYKNEKYKFDKPFLSFKPKHVFIGESKVCEMTEFSGAADKLITVLISMAILFCFNVKRTNNYIFLD